MLPESMRASATLITTICALGPSPLPDTERLAARIEQGWGRQIVLETMPTCDEVLKLDREREQSKITSTHCRATNHDVSSGISLHESS